MTEKLIEGVEAALAELQDGDKCSIKISINGSTPTKKKCFIWLHGMMIQVPCDSTVVDATIDF